ncbi:MAG: sulfurtransferase TusA family protein [Acidimicrobiia bacterium]|nr:sulfurtransferase TusA family protein [Acidimicrobiia bacterium]
MTQDIGDIAVAEVLDTSGLLCPLPVYQAALALKKLQPGEILELICTDPGSLEDIPALARQRHDLLVAVDDQGSTQRFWLEKGANQ